ncbi:AsnC family transcriptional regulator [Halovivax gelatinilyticus]|uniref:AsnC family transcriptional regulator n=1 Tax=Halovivax gelatinilyticus TaxID=2961597 RepID=UPI0020CA5C45|nr:AsnC family transcriptional regulator [Halovivax gelatinilyticus]
MRTLDETDLEILRLLVEDARRPYSEIAERVGLSPPAVSDRVDRLEAQGIVRGFTVDLDRRKLKNRIPVLITLKAAPGDVDRIYESIRRLDGVEHVFKQFDGTVRAHANAPDRNVDGWLTEALDLDGVISRDVALLSDVDWAIQVAASDFSLTCPVCDTEVTGSGETARVGDEVHVFCCPTCESEYRSEYERHSRKAE